MHSNPANMFATNLNIKDISFVFDSPCITTAVCMLISLKTIDIIQTI